MASDLPKSPIHPLYAPQNRLLAANGFDALVEKPCATYYMNDGMPRRSARLFLPDAVCRPLRRTEIALGDHLAMHRPPIARRVSGLGPER